MEGGEAVGPKAYCEWLWLYGGCRSDERLEAVCDNYVFNPSSVRTRTSNVVPPSVATPATEELALSQSVDEDNNSPNQKASRWEHLVARDKSFAEAVQGRAPIWR